MTRPKWFDPKVTLGNVLTVASMLLALVSGYITLKMDVQASSMAIAELRQKVEPLEAFEPRMAVVERNQVIGREARERSDDVLEELRKQNTLILQAIARLEAKAR